MPPAESRLALSKLSSAITYASPGHPVVDGVDIIKCLSEEGTDQPATYRGFLEAQPARLQAEVGFFSARGSGLNVTIAVAFDTGRLYMLEGLCASWRGSLSAAVYLSIMPEVAANGTLQLQVVTEAALAVQGLFQRMERKGSACTLDVVLYSERVASELVRSLFPVNALRNAALLMARTPLVFILDGDLLVSSDLSQDMANPARYQQVLGLAESRAFIVVPAFDSRDAKTAHYCASAGKEASRSAIETGALRQFLGEEYPPAHSPTNYTAWAAATQPYAVDYRDGYEPWGILHRRLTPFFDVRYRGYGKNKIQFLRVLNAAGFAYTVHPSAFIVHRPHRTTAARRLFVQEIIQGKAARLGASSSSSSSSSSSRGTSQQSTNGGGSSGGKSHQNGGKAGAAAKGASALAARSGGGDQQSSVVPASAQVETVRVELRPAAQQASSSGGGSQSKADGNGIHATTNAFYTRMIQQLAQGRYQTLVTPAFQRCRQQLPWWQGYQQTGVAA